MIRRRLAEFKTSIDINETVEGVTIEQKIEKITTLKESIDGEPTTMIYTERKDGVMPEYDIRTDKWDLAIDAMNEVTKDNLRQREERHKKTVEPDKKIEEPKKPEQNNNEGK